MAEAFLEVALAVQTATASAFVAEGEEMTLASRVRDLAVASPDQLAMRYKALGIWHEYSWGEVWEIVLDVANGLLALGVDPGDRVSCQSEDRPEWMFLDLATVAVGGCTVGLYPVDPVDRVEYLLNDCRPRVHFGEGQEQLDKVVDLELYWSGST